MGLRAVIAVLGMFIMVNVHSFALKSMQSWAMVAIFSVCFRVFQLFQRGSDVTGTILYSNVAQKEEKTGYRLTMLVCRNLLFLSMIFAIIGGLLGKFLVIIISSTAYIEAYSPLLIMLPGIVLMNTGAVLNSSYWGRGYPLKIIIAPYIAGAIGLAMDTIFIPRFGASGAALAFSCMCLLWFVYIIEIFRRDSGFYLSEIVIPHYSDFIDIFSRVKNKLGRSAT
jgi:O-antigen/teichoic acid export membrane protein